MSPGLVLSILIALAAISGGCASDEGGGNSASPAPRESSGARAAPSANAPIPQRPSPLAERMRQTRDALYRAIGRWLAEGDPRERTPREVTLYALHQQRIYTSLARSRRLAHAVIARLEGDAAAEARDTIIARRRLASLASSLPRGRLRTGQVSVQRDGCHDHEHDHGDDARPMSHDPS